MKMRFAALAAALVVSSVGCSAIKPGGACGDACSPCGGVPCHVATSQNAPRGGILQGRCAPSCGVMDGLGWTQKGSCGSACGGGCGPFGSGDACCGGCQDSCLQNGLSKLLDCNGGCNGGMGGCRSSGDENYNFNPGPPTGQVAYPYYTTRGPRDFLSCNPPSIGPR